MNKNFYRLLFIIIAILNLTITSMEEKLASEPIPWDKLPIELKSEILKEVAQGESMEQILTKS